MFCIYYEHCEKQIKVKKYIWHQKRSQEIKYKIQLNSSTWNELLFTIMGNVSDIKI